MSSLSGTEKRRLESLFEMQSGYVLNFSDATFRDFVLDHAEADIHSEPYRKFGASKAKKLRAFWDIESDWLVGKLLNALIDHRESRDLEIGEDASKLICQCREIAKRLTAAGPRLEDLKAKSVVFDAVHLAEQIRRIEASINSDPALAIGTAKELIETCCKTILADRGKPVEGAPDIPSLTKATLKELRLVPEGIPDAARGSDVIKRLLSNLGTIGNGLAELRSLYGTGHGRHGKATGLESRHAKLAVGAASTLVTFLLDTHLETKK